MLTLNEFVEKFNWWLAVADNTGSVTLGSEDINNISEIIEYLVNESNKEPVIYGYWTGIKGDVCSECGASLSEIMDADSYYAIGFNPNELVACPFCGVLMDRGSE